MNKTEDRRKIFITIGKKQQDDFAAIQHLLSAHTKAPFFGVKVICDYGFSCPFGFLWPVHFV
jgi:hypothetical protein